MFGVLRPLVIAFAAVVIGIVLVFYAPHILTPSPDLRPAVNRLLLQNRSEERLRRLTLTRRAVEGDALIGKKESRDELRADDRWDVEYPLHPEALVDLAFELDGMRYEFDAIAWTGPDLRDLHIVTIETGPRVGKRPPTRITELWKATPPR